MKKELIFALFVLCSMFVTAQACLVAPSELESWWPLDETNGTLAEDIEGSNNGTHVNSPTPIAGVVDGALSFDGSTEYINVGTLGNFGSNMDNNSFAFWMKTTNTAIQNPFGMANTGNSILAFLINRNSNAVNVNGTLGFFLRDAAGDVLAGAVNTNTGVNDGEWHFVVYNVITSTKTVEIYVDGVLQTTFYKTQNNYGPHANLPIPLYIGAGNSNNIASSFFDGDLDEIQFFNKALSQAEVTAEFNAGSAGKCKPCIADTDSDTSCDFEDNCLNDANPDQLNTDGDSNGDVCDTCPFDATDTCNVNEQAMENINSSGGTIVTGNSIVNLTFPASALSNDTSISIGKNSNITSASFGLGTINFIEFYDFAPDGLTFASSLLVMTYDQGVMTECGTQETSLDIYFYNSTSENATPLNATQNCAANTLTVNITHFSGHGIGSPAAAEEAIPEISNTILQIFILLIVALLIGSALIRKQ